MVEQNRRLRAPSLDVIAFGATSLVGQILCDYLLEEFLSNASRAKWAQRASQGKPKNWRASLGPDRSLHSSCGRCRRRRLRKLCASTRVVVSTVPSPVRASGAVGQACAESADDYCDLTARGAWIRRRGALRSGSTQVGARASCIAAASTRSRRTWACTFCSATR